MRAAAEAALAEPNRLGLNARLPAAFVSIEQGLLIWRNPVCATRFSIELASTRIAGFRESPALERLVLVSGAVSVKDAMERAAVRCYGSRPRGRVE